MRLLQALEKPYLIGDGANGTCLAARGFSKRPYDLANLLAPELVVAVHREYFEAGADFVETNTFSANRFRLEGHNVDTGALNEAGARLAREAAGPDKLVLGAIGPAGKPMEPFGHIPREAIVESAREQAEALVLGGVDGFFLETFIDLEELFAAIEGVRQASDLPILACKAYIEDGEMLAEGLPMRCSQAMAELGIAGLGANCIVGPQRMLDLVRQVAEGSSLPIVAFPTPGLPQLVKGQVAYDTSPEYFAKACLRLVEEGAKVVGGCCGTTPAHIRALRETLDNAKIKVRKRTSVQIKDAKSVELAATPPTELAEKLGQKFITAVEMDVPRGLNVDKLVASCRALKIAGTDVINISDGARARLRMNPMAVCQQIQSRVGVEATMHFSCRDRNLLAIQADLLGCHAMGVRNILAVTGDPANIGDYPSATSVFDVDAIGMVRILSRLNEGIDLAGYSVGVKCGFTIACAFNPVAMEPELELDRLKRKAEAGAHLVYTQPVFKELDVDATMEACRSVGLPVFIGVMPLRSARHAEFMHNEVPGIRIPNWLRAAIGEAKDDASALEIGMEACEKLAAYIRKVGAAGLYIMPPANSHEMAIRVMEAAR